MKELDGRVAVVTGAASGIGRAFSQRLAAQGMKVVMADVEGGALEAAAGALKADGHQVLAVQTDISQADSVSALAERAVDAYGKVHVLCNNAGVFAAGLSWEAPQSDYDWVFGVNVWGVLHGLRSFVPHMLAHGEPSHIVNTASMAAVTTAPFTAPYYMSKAAVFSLSESLYGEMQARSAAIGVSVLCPELVDTAIARGERNRPEHLKRKSGEGDSPERELVEQAIHAATPTGSDPTVLADRAIEAIYENRFYVLAPEGNSWRDACNTRLEDIRLARNPTNALPDP
ncbi:MAG: SDR family NAD(P)-dependent oxidoreductase [Myxococcota bacterium]|jgi:NAD(P)-dependent dehydrogenase (short-subunit alcohol dehydrogenase family)|nr:SDR family NAD(P)-dependent oxidoreductase [Myxococcota bacterium]